MCKSLGDFQRFGGIDYTIFRIQIILKTGVVLHENRKKKKHSEPHECIYSRLNISAATDCGCIDIVTCSLVDGQRL
jgi:hypothetical protein